MIDIDELKRLAEAATPGPWGCDGSYICPARIEDGTTYIESWRAIADAHDMENVRFIAAANPTAILALIADLQRLEKARATDAGMIMDMTRDIVSVGEALGIPGEEQEGGVGEFIEAIEQLKQTAPDVALHARVADLLHLLQFAKIETPSAGDAAQAGIAMNDLARMLAVAAPPAQQAEQPIKWGSAGTVGNLIAQLRTIDPAMPIYASLRIKNEFFNRIRLMGLIASYESGDGRFIVKDGPERCVVIWTQPDDRQAEHSAWLEQVMEQAQVFASAWALVGGPFDTGDGLEHAEEEKERLRALLGGEV